MKHIEKKLNIGLFIDTFYPMIDGVITVVDNYARRLVKFANVTVFTIGSRDKNYVDNFPYKVVRCAKFDIPGLDYDLGLPGLDAKFQKELKESKLDIVHIHSPFTLGKVGVNYAKKHKIPCIATNHSQFKQDFFKATKSPAITDMLLKGVVSVLNKCDENWSVNSMTRDLFYEYGLKEKPYIMPNGTDFKIADYDKYDIDVNKKYHISEDDKVLLFVGRMNDIKNIPFLIDSYNMLLKKDSSFKLMLVGDGTRTEHYRQVAKELGIEKHIIFAGKVADKKLLGSIYKRSDMFVFPSFYDTDGLVKKEAACFKTPSIVIEGSFTSSDITDNVNGYVSKNTKEDFCNKILYAFENKGEYHKVCENAQREIYKNWDDIISDVLNRYRFLIEQKKIRNKVIAKKSQYTKTIRQVQKQHQKKKVMERKRKNRIKRKSLQYPKTIKKISSKKEK